jgi:uncharacterized protein (TIGR02145 family)
MMKKLLFLLVFPLLGLVGIAHASVTVELLDTDFNNKTVTVRVEYANAVNDRAWVWIYLCSMQGMFQPAEISAASATSGSVLYTTTNTRGFFVTASPATVTATLSNAPDPFSCCAYGSDAPPNMTESNGTYTFKGTSPFILTDASGTTTQTVTGNTLLASALTITPVTLTDETGYPNIFCPYTGSDLYNVATYFCQQRASGAQNWEAYIKDSRDNRIYRIVKMPTGTWWMADDLLWDGKPSPDATGYTVRGKVRLCGEHYGCGRFYYADATGAGAFSGSATDRRASDVCPTGWIIPSYTELVPYLTADADPRAYVSEKEGGRNEYGLSFYMCGASSCFCGTTALCMMGGSTKPWIWADFHGSGSNNQNDGDGMIIRCVRDL